MKFIGTLYSVRKDREGEVRLALNISQQEASKVMEIPEDMELAIEITPQRIEIIGAKEDPRD